MLSRRTSLYKKLLNCYQQKWQTLCFWWYYTVLRVVQATLAVPLSDLAHFYTRCPSWPDAAFKKSESLPGIKPGLFCSLDKHVHHLAMEGQNTALRIYNSFKSTTLKKPHLILSKTSFIKASLNSINFQDIRAISVFFPCLFFLFSSLLAAYSVYFNYCNF